MNRWLALTTVLLTACWTTELPELPSETLDFAPAAASAPEGWAVDSWTQGDMVCPDGAPATFWLVHPRTSETALPMAVIFHDHALDYPADPARPSVSAFRSTSALSHDSATRAVFELLGMGLGGGSGELVSALTNAGYQVILPMNCWGDVYADSIDARTNDPTADGFTRRGFESAQFGWFMASDNAWATINRVDLPVEVDYAGAVVIGIGDGARAIGELLADEEPLTTAILEAPLDDVAPFYDEPDQYPDEYAALQRIFADADDAATGSLAAAPLLPARTAYLYSRLDPSLPAATHDGALERLNGEDSAWVYETGATTHAPLASDATLAAEVVSWLSAAPSE